MAGTVLNVGTSGRNQLYPVFSPQTEQAEDLGGLTPEQFTGREPNCSDSSLRHLLSDYRNDW